MLRDRYLGVTPSALMTESVRCHLRSIARARAWPAARIWIVCRWISDGDCDSDGLEGAGCSLPSFSAAGVPAASSAPGCGRGSAGCAAGSSRGLSDSVEPLFRTDFGPPDDEGPSGEFVLLFSSVSLASSIWRCSIWPLSSSSFFSQSGTLLIRCLRASMARSSSSSPLRGEAHVECAVLGSGCVRRQASTHLTRTRRSAEAVGECARCSDAAGQSNEFATPGETFLQAAVFGRVC
ncbi:hypothetical protein VTG60DRAFT_286 [Thermothelomyces hinnuleus]